MLGRIKFRLGELKIKTQVQLPLERCSLRAKISQEAKKKKKKKKKRKKPATLLETGPAKRPTREKRETTSDERRATQLAS